MGFPEDRVKRVLKNFRNNLNVAMDHLINTPPEMDAGNESDGGDDTNEQ